MQTTGSASAAGSPGASSTDASDIMEVKFVPKAWNIWFS